MIKEENCHGFLFNYEYFTMNSQLVISIHYKKLLARKFL